MHELSIALSIIDVVTEEAERQQGRIVAIHLKLGPLAGVVKEALVSAFGLAREGTSLEQAELLVEEVPLVAYCPVCATAATLPSVQDIGCPTCGTPTAEIISGRELEVVAFEIES